MSEFGEPMSLDSEVEALSDAKKALAFSRALKIMNVKHDYIDGDLVFPEDTDFDVLVALTATEAFIDAMAYELKKLAIDVVIGSLVEKGILYADGIHENGEIRYLVDQSVL